MAINVTGPGQRGSNNPAAPAPPTPDPTGDRARVSNAIAQGNINPNSLGSIQAPTFAHPGAAGVTSYGLFSGAGAGQPPRPTSPMIGPPPMSTTMPFQRPPIGRIQPPIARMPGQIGPGAGSLQGQNTPAPTQHAMPMPQQPAPTITRPPALAFGRAPLSNMPAKKVVGQSGGLAPALPPAPAQGQPMAATSAPPPPGGTASGFSSDNGGDGTLHSTAGGAGQPTPEQDAANYGATHETEAAGAGDGGGGIGQAVTDAAANAAGGLAGSAGQIAGTTLADFQKAYNDATGGGSQQSFSDFFNQMAPSFQDGSLIGDVGQNMTSMMDPAAWQQMAANRNAAADSANLVGLNTAERRMQDMQGRTGFANPGGVMGQMYQDYANRGIQSQRDIFNDTLNNQMSAIGKAGDFALGQRGQDVSRNNLLTGIAAQGAGQDLANARLDNPSAIEALRSAMGAAGQVGGAAAGGVGDLLKLLPLLAA